MKEIWKYIEGYEDYMISNLGRVKSNQSYNNPKHEWRYLTPSDNSKGYKLVGLVKEGKRKNYYIHRLVASSFIPNPNNFKEINHIDNDKNNNCADNLEWCSRSYNVKYSYDKGEHIQPKGMEGRKGKEHPISVPVKQYDIDGNFIKEYESAKMASDETKICYVSIKKCRQGKQKTAGGFVWTY